MIYGRAYTDEYYNTECRWFAWYPVVVESGRKVWWEHVYRKRERYLSGSDWYWIYRLKHDN